MPGPSALCKFASACMFLYLNFTLSEVKTGVRSFNLDAIIHKEGMRSQIPLFLHNEVSCMLLPGVLSLLEIPVKRFGSRGSLPLWNAHSAPKIF